MDTGMIDAWSLVVLVMRNLNTLLTNLRLHTINSWSSMN
jgi:hypothetical protein